MRCEASNSQKLNQFYKQYKDKARAKPDDLMYIAANEEDQTCAALRLLPYEGFLFLRSVLTAPQHRGLGIASSLIEYVIKKHEGPIYTLPTLQALSLYRRLGFQPVSTPEIPVQLLASYRRFRQANNGPTVMVINLPLR
jgi:N-acetylglutamate synthase-like GNAT family acetyltransferase